MNPIENAELFVNVGASIYWTPEESARAMANLEAAAAERGQTVPEFIAAVSRRPKANRTPWPQNAL